MWSDFVVVQLVLMIVRVKFREPVLVETLGAYLSVEGLGARFLHGLAGLEPVGMRVSSGLARLLRAGRVS